MTEIIQMSVFLLLSLSHEKVNNHSGACDVRKTDTPGGRLYY